MGQVTDSAQQTSAAKTELPVCQHARWSFSLGMAGIIACCFFTGIPAIVLGHMALAEINRSDGTLGGRSEAISGLVMGYSITILSVLLLPIVVFVAYMIKRMYSEGLLW